jgi:hypothetical protein
MHSSIVVMFVTLSSPWDKTGFRGTVAYVIPAEMDNNDEADTAENRPNVGSRRFKLGRRADFVPGLPSRKAGLLLVAVDVCMYACPDAPASMASSARHTCTLSAMLIASSSSSACSHAFFL